MQHDLKKLHNGSLLYQRSNYEACFATGTNDEQNSIFVAHYILLVWCELPIDKKYLDNIIVITLSSF